MRLRRQALLSRWRILLQAAQTSGQLEKLPLLILLPPCAIPKIPVLVVKAVSGFVLKLGCISSCEVGLIDMLRPTDGLKRYHIMASHSDLRLSWPESKGFAQPV